MFQLGSVSTGTLAPEFVTGNPPAYQSLREFCGCATCLQPGRTRRQLSQRKLPGYTGHEGCERCHAHTGTRHYGENISTEELQGFTGCVVHIVLLNATN